MSGETLFNRVVSLASRIPILPQRTSTVRANFNDFIPYSRNGDELVDDLAEMYRKSSTHRSVIDFKTTYSIGDGLSSEGVQDFINIANAEGESLNEVTSKVFQSHWIFNNAYIEVIRINGKEFWSHMDTTNIRISKDRKGFIFHPDWSLYTSNKGDAKFFNAYPNFGEVEGLEGERAIVHWKGHEPAFIDYPLPDYFGSYVDGTLDVDYEISKYNFTRFQQDFTPSAVMDIYGVKTEEEGKRVIKDLRNHFTGENNQGKILAYLQKDINVKTNVQILNDIKEGHFTELQAIIGKKLFISHGVPKILLGFSESGSLGDTNEILTQFELFTNNKIKSRQNSLLRLYKKMMNLGDFGNSDDLTFLKTAPVSLMGRFDPADILTVDEAREIFGKEPLETGQVTINDQREVVDNVGGQTDGE